MDLKRRLENFLFGTPWERDPPDRSARSNPAGERDDTGSGERTPRRSLDARIVRLVEHNGGAIRQRDIVRSVDSSAATVSRHLSEMEGDEIDRIEIGREKIVCRPVQELEIERSAEERFPEVRR